MRFSRCFENDQVCTSLSRKVIGLHVGCVQQHHAAQYSNVNEYKSVGDAAAAAQRLQQRCRYLTDDFLRLKVAYSNVVVLCTIATGTHYFKQFNSIFF